MPRGTKTLIAANVVMFLLQGVLDDRLTIWAALWPPGASEVYGPEVGFEPWQLVTYAFLHGGMGHIFFNMFALYMFGGTLERLFGTRFYLSFYFASVVSAALTQLVVATLTGSTNPTIGASGGVFGLLLAFGMYFPRQRVVLLFPPIPMQAWLFVTLYGALELFLGVSGTQAGVAHFAHLGGMLGAFLMIQRRRGRPPFAQRR